MTTIIIIALCIFIFWLVNDAIVKRNELSKDESFSRGLINKFPKLFEVWENDNFIVNSTPNGHVKILRILDINEFAVNIEITVMYQAGKQIQFIVQLFLFEPVNKHIKTKSFFYSAAANEDALIKATQYEIGSFIKYTLEGGI